MTNENELDVLSVLDKLSFVGGFLRDDKNITNAINLIKSQQSRIDLLESAIREFLKADDAKYLDLTKLLQAKETLRNLVENKS